MCFGQLSELICANSSPKPAIFPTHGMLVSCPPAQGSWRSGYVCGDPSLRTALFLPAWCTDCLFQDLINDRERRITRRDDGSTVARNLVSTELSPPISRAIPRSPASLWRVVSNRRRRPARRSVETRHSTPRIARWRNCQRLRAMQSAPRAP